MYVKRLGETCMTLDRRSLLLLFLLLLLYSLLLLRLRLIRTKVGQEGNFKYVHVFDGEKIQPRKFFVVESGSRILHAFQYILNMRSSQAVGQCGPCRVPHTGARREAVWTGLCVPGVRFAVYVKGLGETHMTLDKRLLLLPLR